MLDIQKILVANRGEIAVRIIRTCKKMGISTVSVYSDADTYAPHVSMADESFYIGASPSAESYLVMDRILEAANETGADAIHPGYGFLSENAEFARRCSDANIIFIGPSPQAIELMGDKMKAREMVESLGIPFPPGLVEPVSEKNDLEGIAQSIGYPILIKAAAGGGGKGMRIVREELELRAAVKTAASEAASAFGDSRVYIEKYLENPRHVEIQVLADNHDHYLHLYDRECSVQRRHQKVIEEAPCSILTEDLRTQMTSAALEIAKACDYTGVGTVEFLVDRHLNYYFLEMNTRLQVEHPVTEMITGLDLVEMQILVAQDRPLTIKQSNIEMKGHSIECRIYAENPFEGFLPDIGSLYKHRIPSGQGVRVDSGIEEGAKVPIYYDPMISKLSVHGSDREEAIARMKVALAEYEITGCTTTIPFCEYTLNHPAFTSGKYDTHFVSQYFEKDLKEGVLDTLIDAEPNDTETIMMASLSALFSEQIQQSNSSKTLTEQQDSSRQWWSARRNS
jgi:acetyl-CoA carboxylase biotin carboxylase subunit